MNGIRRGALSDLNDEPMPRLPPLNARLGITYEHNDALQLTSTLRLAAGQNRIGPFEEPTDGYAVLDFLASTTATGSVTCTPFR